MTEGNVSNYFIKKYFKENAKNTRNIWNGIKFMINIKGTVKNEPSALLVNNKFISDSTN